jgi:hypothetical protein
MSELVPIELKRGAIVRSDGLSGAGVAGKLNFTAVELSKQISALETQLYE